MDICWVVLSAINADFRIDRTTISIDCIVECLGGMTFTHNLLLSSIIDFKWTGALLGNWSLKVDRRETVAAWFATTQGTQPSHLGSDQCVAAFLPVCVPLFSFYGKEMRHTGKSFQGTVHVSEHL